ncbi:MAG: RNA 3'-terminal phosphate cyclase [Anaerolineales bacterium]
MLQIDGSQGEGGGQVLRTSLALACLSQTPIQMIHIRARRPKPGLQAQHLQAVRTATAISQAKVSGDHLGSQSLYFAPGPIQAGDYHFDIGTAGATTLVLQTIFFPLCFANGVSHLTITGGTHVPWSPPFEYVNWHWLACLREMGVQATLTLDRAGFYPPGGGQIRAEIHPTRKLLPLQWAERGKQHGLRALSGAANLPTHVLHRQRERILTRLGKAVPVEVEEMSAPSPGSVVIALAEFERGRGCSVGLGKKGKLAEVVADEATNGLLGFLASPASVDEHLADQLLLPFALAEGVSEITTLKITPHLLTNAAVIEQFGQAKIKIEGQIGQFGRVEVIPR